MKALFYTATAVFITLAGVIAYFALQTPASSVGGARIVLDIDVSGMPAGKDGAAAALDPYANEPEDKPEPAEGAASAEVTENSRAGGQQANAAVLRDDPAAPEAPPAEEIPSPPPGTALAGLDQGRPLFREVPAAAQSPAAPARGEPGVASEPAPARRSAAAEPAFALPGTNLALPAEPLPANESNELRGAADVSPRETAAAATQALPAEGASQSAVTPPEVQAAVPPPPALPPMPRRRPSDIPGPDANAGDGSWAGVQFATTEVTAPKPARIAILLRGVGRSEQDGADAIAKLPSAVSLGFLPYAADSLRLASQAREKGHEIIVQLPLEPSDYPTSNPGPDTLLTSLRPEENAARLQTVLNRFEGHAGVTNFMGGKMLQSKDALKPVLEDIKARGLVYVGESNNSHNTVRQVAREINLRYGAAQVLIDTQANPEAIDKALARLAGIARQRGSAIGIGIANAVTIEQVQAWSEKLAAQGITLVPVGALAQTPGSS
jgi:polysaccharide deacetylase 2 family uncharacterized protein YibQ